MVITKLLLLQLLLIVFTSSLQFKKQKHEFLKGSLSDFRNAELKRHNELRAKHGAPPLQLDNELNNFAQKYAQHLAEIDAQVLVHSGRSGYGENIYAAWANPKKAYENGAATQAWYDQVKNYNFDHPNQSTGRTGHFTQVVWVSSKKVGFGIGTFNGKVNGTDFIVANYFPIGNWVGDQKANVLKPIQITNQI